MRRSLLVFTGWFGASVVLATPPPMPDAPPSNPIVRVPAAPLSDAEAARRDALTRYGVGLIQARTEQIVQAAKQIQLAADRDPTAAAPLRELARLYAELGRDPAAIRAAQKALTLDSTDYETARLLGRLWFDAKKPSEAVKAYQLAAGSKQLTDPLVKLSILKDLARSADAAADAVTAELSRRDALKLLADSKSAFLKEGLFTLVEWERERAKLYEGLGHALVKQREFATASAAYQTARDIYADPKMANDPSGVARVHGNLSASLAAQGERAAAIKELEKYLAFRPTAFEPYERLVDLYRQMNRTAELPAVLARLAEANPKNPAPQWLAAALALNTEPAVADTLFRRLLPSAQSADPFRVMVAAYRESGRTKELLDHLDRTYKAARPVGYEDDSGTQKDKDPDPPPRNAIDRARWFTAALKAVPPKIGFTAVLVRQLTDDGDGFVDRHPDTLELVSGLATRDGKASEFTAALSTFARRKSDVRVTWLLLMQLSTQHRWNDLANAAEELKVVTRNKQQFIYYSIAGQVAVANAELGREQTALNKLAELGNGFYADQQRVRVLNILGKPEEALKVCERVLEKDRPTGSDLRALRLVQSDSLNLLKRFSESEMVLRELLDTDPDDVLILNNLGYHLADQGRKLEEAEGLIRRAIELDQFERVKRGDPEPVSGGYTDSLGWVLFRRGKVKEARELLEQAAASPEAAPDAIVWDHLGDVAFRQGDRKRAAEAWKRAAELYTHSHHGRQDGRLDEVKRKQKLAE
jgi:tetratricopeptide (TPR) repeat protein